MPLKVCWLHALAVVPLTAMSLAASGAGGGGAAGAGAGRGGARGGVPASLLGAMEDMQAMVLALKKNAADPEKMEQTLQTLALFERDVAICKTQRPPGNRVADAAKGLVDYRHFMTVLLRTALDLEDAVVNKKPDDIKKLIAKLDELEESGHDEFR